MFSPFPDNFQSINCLTFIQIPPSTGLKVKVLYRLFYAAFHLQVSDTVEYWNNLLKTGSKFLEYTFFTASWFKHVSKTIWSLNAAIPRKRSFLGQFLGNYQDRSVSFYKDLFWKSEIHFEGFLGWCFPYSPICHSMPSEWYFLGDSLIEKDPRLKPNSCL